MSNIEFAYPELLFGLIIIVPMLVWYILKDKDNHPSLQISSLRAFSKVPVGYKVILKHVEFAFKLIVISLLIVMLAKPQSANNWEDITTEGIDIVLALDISGSMTATDFRPNRFEASKDVAIEFIAGRENDRIGLVVYSGESFTQCPLTNDLGVVINLVNELEQGIIEDGTAIGVGLATAVNRLKESKAKSKVIILLTDGVNNIGSIDPITAANIAAQFGIRVYTIGVGSNGYASVPVQTIFGVQYQQVEVKIDEAVLKEIAQLTGGKYFRATSKSKLIDIYNEINKLEKSKIEVKKVNTKEDKFLPFAIIAAALLFLSIIIKYLFLRSIP
jgi:Ca-activated chloride channel family protein